MNIEVSLASRRKEPLALAHAAVFVVTGEDIRRSGVTSLADALRMVPGIHVGHIDANKWAVSSRGFNGRFSNKLLVLVDGRTVYSPLFSGVFWELQEIALEDIDRIEVIRGSGATLWGSNAVNGIINVVTKEASDTQGGLVSAAAGSEERVTGTIRYGSKLGRNVYYRVTAKATEHDAFRSPLGGRAADDWSTRFAGIRVDWGPTDVDRTTMQAHATHVDVGQTYYDLVQLRGDSLVQGNVDAPGWFDSRNAMVSWDHTLSPTSALTFGVYADATTFEDLITRERRYTVDVDAQHRFAFGSQHNLVWGVGLRYTTDNITNTFNNSVQPTHRAVSLFSAFLQDDIDLVPNHVRLTIGSKVERSSFTGIEYQPNIRLLWTPNLTHVVWGAVSRAARTPARGERDGFAIKRFLRADELPAHLTDGLPVLFVVGGRPGFRSEHLLAFDLGYRYLPRRAWSLDVATFYNIYTDLRSGGLFLPERVTTPKPEHWVLPLRAQNNLSGHTYGLEVAADARPRPWLRLRATGTLLRISLDVSQTQDFTAKGIEHETPHRLFTIQAFTDLPWSITADGTVRYVGPANSLATPEPDGTRKPIGGYVTCDARIAWMTGVGMEVSVVGQNLLQSAHPEFEPELLNTLPTLVERGVYGKIAWRF